MNRSVTAAEFRAHFADRAVVFTRLPAGRARDLAAQANDAVGHGDAALHASGEFDALFALLAAGAAELVLADDQDRPTDAGSVVAQYDAVSLDEDGFYAQPMVHLEITGWPEDAPTLGGAVAAPAGARMSLWPTDPADPRPTPPPDAHGVLFTTTAFELANTGNRTLHAPKPSWRAEPGRRFAGMSRISLKAMYNDPSQMREALAWRAFDRAGVPASRHTYATLTMNGRYRGLFSVIEDVDRGYVRERFGDHDRGNLYKACCGALGCATLEHRVGDDGDDSGRQYRVENDPTYDLKSWSDAPGAESYDDLAALVRAVDGTGLPGGEGRFTTDAYRAGLESVLHVPAFLRWAGVNVLLGSWDNYFATPSNYYLYNAGRPGSADDVVAAPWFTFLPWDYDNSFGIDYVGTAWQYTDLVDWPSATVAYCRRNNAPHRTSRIPLVTNLLRHPELLRYHLDHVEHLLDGDFDPDTVTRLVGSDGGGLWDRVEHAVYGEAGTPFAAPATGRQFTNDEVYTANGKQFELHHGETSIPAITHYVRMRHDRAREQLAQLRKQHPSGSSGARFPVAFEPFPA